MKLLPKVNIPIPESFRKAITPEEVSRLLNRLHARDRAKYVMHRDLRMRKQLYAILSSHDLADLFENVHPLESRVKHFRELDIEHGAKVLYHMHSDDVVDILNMMKPKRAEQYLELIAPTKAKKIRALRSYHHELAGSIMTTEFVAVSDKLTAGEALDRAKAEALEAETIYYIYIGDAEGKLKRVATLKELILADKNQSVSKIGRKHLVTVSPETTKREASKVIAEYDLLALPVVDKDGRMVGLITIDDIVDVIHARGADRLAKFSAASNVEMTDNPFASAFKRLPWLIMLLLLGMLTATLIGHFENTLAQLAILGAFIPVIAGTTGNSGTQSLAIVVRGIATGKVEKISLWWYLSKEFVTAFITSLVSGVALTVIIYLWKQELSIGIVAGSSLALSILVGTMAGSVVPLVLNKLRIDPAVASGPLITTICDIISMAIYFGVATLLLTQLL